MKTSIYFHPVFLDHDTGSGHPESADRLRSILTELRKDEFKDLIWKEPTAATKSQISLVHLNSYIDKIFESIPKTGKVHLDEDTVVSPKSLVSALHAVGAVCLAIDDVITGNASNVFCAVRPPGHHAEPDRSMGFCIFNNVAIGAFHAIHHHKLNRVAVVDFDVHHGNGTQIAFQGHKNLLFASTHQAPFYPGTGAKSETGGGNIFNEPLLSGSGTAELQNAMKNRILPALEEFSPELILISAGFDAHSEDPLASLHFIEEDYVWITKQLMAVAKKYSANRIVSSLEGGYNLSALSSSVASHVRTLMNVV